MSLGGEDNLPKKCLRMNDEGALPTCTKTADGSWEVDYPAAVDQPGGGAFAALFVLALVVGVIGAIWKVSTARRMARDSGKDEGDATAMTLLTDDGFEAAYLASNLRGQTAGPAPVAPSRGAAADRLAELQTLRERGLVTDEEYAAARQKILDDL